MARKRSRKSKDPHVVYVTSRWLDTLRGQNDSKPGCMRWLNMRASGAPFVDEYYDGSRRVSIALGTPWEFWYEVDRPV